MPKVPVLDNFQVNPQVATTPAISAPQGENVAAKQAQQFGSALMNAGGEAGRVVSDIQQEANKVRVIKASDDIERVRQSLTYTPPDETGRGGGFIHLKGENALSPGEKPLDQLYAEQFDKEVSRITDSLGNDAQKLAFKMEAARSKSRLSSDISRHLATEFQTHRKSVFEGAIGTARQAAGLEWGNAERVAEHAATARAAVGELTRVAGIGGKEAEMVKVDQLSGLHADVVLAAIQGGKLDYAREYMTQNTAELNSKTRLQLTNALDQGDKEVRIYTEVDRIWKTSGGDIGKALTLSKDVDPKYRGPVEQALRTINHDKVALEEANVKKAEDQGWEIVARDKSLRNLPAGFMGEGGTLRGTTQREMRDYIEAWAKRREAEAKGKFEPDLNVYAGLIRMSVDNPTEFLAQMERNPKRLEPYIGDTLTKSLIDRAAGMSKNDAKAMESQTMLRSAMTMVRSEAQAAGIDYSPKEGTQAAKDKAAFESALQMELDRKVAAKKAPLTPDEIRSTAMSMIRTEREQGSGIFGIFATEKKGFQIPADQRDKFIVKPYKDIPYEIKFEIENTIRRQGRKVIPEEVERTYSRAVRAGYYKDK